MNGKEMTARRFYLVLPLLVLPFLTIAFWLMGGGETVSGKVGGKSGMNTSLPDAHNGKDSGRDKLSFYELAYADSVKRREARQNDPNFQVIPREPFNEEMEKAEILPPTFRSVQGRINIPDYQVTELPQYEVNLAERSMPSEKPLIDPELEAINQTIEKLAALQNPAKPASKTTVEVVKEVLPVNATVEDEATYFGKKQAGLDRKQFLSDKIDGSKPTKAFAAVIPTTQVLQSGSVIKLQLSQPVSVSGVVIPSGTALHGTVSIEKERLLVHISTLPFENTLYPVALSVFDLDGMEGIHIPGSVSREVAKSTAEQSLQSVNVLGFDPSIKTQALSAGIGAAKNLLGRKVKTVRATIPSGYGVLLMDTKRN